MNHDVNHEYRPFVPLSLAILFYKQYIKILNSQQIEKVLFCVVGTLIFLSTR